MVRKLWRSPRIPGLAVHKATGQWRAVFNGRHKYFGKDAKQARRDFDAFLSTWLANGRQPLPEDQPRYAPLPEADPKPAASSTIRDVLAAYLQAIVKKNTDPATGELRADGTYRKEGAWTSEWENLNLAVSGGAANNGIRAGGFGTHFGDRGVDELGEHLLLEWREMLERQTAPVLTRNGINRKVRHIMGALQWAKSKKLIPKETWADCRDLQPLRKGEVGSGRPGRRKKRAVSAAEVEAVASRLEAPVQVNGSEMPGNRQVAAMLRVQHLLGCRPGEVCKMRWQDIDFEGPVDSKRRQLWVYTVPQAKTEHQEDHEDVTYLIGPRAQRILEQFQQAGRAGFVFSPRRSMAERGRARRAGDAFADRWEARAYANAIARAVKNVAEVQHFTPHEVRHGAITRTYQQHGQAAAQARANHSSATTTARYFHRDHSILVEAAGAEG